jgi:hypothetical protein
MLNILVFNNASVHSNQVTTESRVNQVCIPGKTYLKQDPQPLDIVFELIQARHLAWGGQEVAMACATQDKFALHGERGISPKHVTARSNVYEF